MKDLIYLKVIVLLVGALFIGSIYAVKKLIMDADK